MRSDLEHQLDRLGITPSMLDRPLPADEPSMQPSTEPSIEPADAGAAGGAQDRRTEGPARGSVFLATFRRMPTASAEGLDRAGGQRRKGLGETRL